MLERLAGHDITISWMLLGL